MPDPSMRPWTIAVLAFSACRSPACGPETSAPPDAARTALTPSMRERDERDAVPPEVSLTERDERDAVPPKVRLTWRLFETQRWLEGQGEKQESAVIELLVNGGAPSRIQLGRRDTIGCAVRSDTPAAFLDDAVASVVTTVACDHALATVTRANAGELHVVAGDVVDRDSALAGRASLGHPSTRSVQIPAGADVAVDPGLSRIPDEAPGL